MQLHKEMLLNVPSCGQVRFGTELKQVFFVMLRSSRELCAIGFLH